MEAVVVVVVVLLLLLFILGSIFHQQNRISSFMFVLSFKTIKNCGYFFLSFPRLPGNFQRAELLFHIFRLRSSSSYVHHIQLHARAIYTHLGKKKKSFQIRIWRFFFYAESSSLPESSSSGLAVPFSTSPALPPELPLRLVADPDPGMWLMTRTRSSSSSSTSASPLSCG